jgi:DNA-binding MarR family transcriptional regulator
MTRKAVIRAQTPPNSDLPDLQTACAIGPLIGRVRSIALSALDGELQSFGITGMQFVVFKQVADGVAQTAADLCRLMHYDTGSMTRILDRLEERHWIQRERSKDDRRVVRLRVTSAGRGALPRLQDSAGHVVQRMLAGFNATEVKDLHGFLSRMIENGQFRAQRVNPAEGEGR